jgi:hypothetical protein
MEVRCIPVFSGNYHHYNKLWIQAEYLGVVIFALKLKFSFRASKP